MASDGEPSIDGAGASTGRAGDASTGPAGDGAPLRLAGAAAATEDEWRARAAAVLRRMGIDRPEDQVLDRLERTTVEGLAIPALGTASRFASPDRGLPGQAPFVRGAARGAELRGWDVRSRLFATEPTAAAREAADELANGATSVWLPLRPGGLTAETLPDVLAQVALDRTPVVLDGPDALAGARALADLVASRRGTAHSDTCLSVDPIGGVARELGTDSSDVVSVPTDLGIDLVEIADLATTLGTLAMTVDATAAHGAGAGDTQELGYSLAVGAALLRGMADRGITPDRGASLLEFRYAVTDAQFETIAKLRAARLVWHRVLELCGVADDAGQRQHAVTSRPMTTRYDPWVNLLRTTIAAFSAGAGGAAAVTVLPFDSALGVPDRFGRRMARNISTILIAETQATTSRDPAGGAYAIEELTERMAIAAWEEFGRIEAAGGITAAVTDGSLRRRWTAVRSERADRIARRSQPITGVTEFPQLAETLPARPTPAAPGTPGLGWAEPFEKMRDRPAEHPVFLAPLGPVAAHAAAVRFAENALATGGVRAVRPRMGAAGLSSAELQAAFADRPSAVVCLAGPADASSITDLIAALRAGGARWVMHSGLAPEPIRTLFDDRIAEGDDVLAFLHRTREQLEMTA